MDVGMMMVFTSYGWDDCPDARVWEEEIRLARIAADSGFIDEPNNTAASRTRRTRTAPTPTLASPG